MIRMDLIDWLLVAGIVIGALDFLWLWRGM